MDDDEGCVFNAHRQRQIFVDSLAESIDSILAVAHDASSMQMHWVDHNGVRIYGNAKQKLWRTTEGYVQSTDDSVF